MKQKPASSLQHVAWYRFIYTVTFHFLYCYQLPSSEQLFLAFLITRGFNLLAVIPRSQFWWDMANLEPDITHRPLKELPSLLLYFTCFSQFGKGKYILPLKTNKQTPVSSQQSTGYFARRADWDQCASYIHVWNQIQVWSKNKTNTAPSLPPQISKIQSKECTFSPTTRTFQML